jgi:hypothetical protein
MDDLTSPTSPETRTYDAEVIETLARGGHSKHYGGRRATEELAELCGIGRDDDVLDAGGGARQGPGGLRAGARDCPIALEPFEPRVEEGTLELLPADVVEEPVPYTLERACE